MILPIPIHTEDIYHYQYKSEDLYMYRYSQSFSDITNTDTDTNLSLTDTHADTCQKTKDSYQYLYSLVILIGMICFSMLSMLQLGCYMCRPFRKNSHFCFANFLASKTSVAYLPMIYWSQKERIIWI